MPSLRWDELRFLVAIDEAGTLLGAARALNVSHSTVARHLEKAESVVGSRIFLRRGNVLVASEPAQLLLREARRISQEIESLTEMIGQTRLEVEGTVRIATPLTIATHVLAPQLRAMERALPTIRFVFRTELSSDAMLRGEADIAIRISRPVAEGLMIQRIAPCEFGLYATPALAKKQRAAINQGRPMPGPYLAFTDDYARVPETGWLKNLFPDREPVFKANASLALLAAAQTGLGVAALGGYIGRHAEGLELIDTPIPPPNESIYLITHRDQRDIRRVRVVVQYLANLIKSNPHWFRCNRAAPACSPSGPSST
jgi:DNA-binding transcriptional LysR family regulator